MTEEITKDFRWVLLEIMGYRQRVGLAREEEIAGGKMLRIDIPVKNDGEEEETYVTEYYGTSSIYALRPVSEDVAREALKGVDPRPARPATYKPDTQLQDFTDEEVPY